MARRRRVHQDQELSSHRSTRKERPVQRNAANARERARMRVLSKAFSRLKTSLPWVPADTKLSKLDTLRLASSYISHLRKVLAEDDTQQGSLHPINFTWPFTFGAASSRSADPSSPAEDEEEDMDSCSGTSTRLPSSCYEPASELATDRPFDDMAHPFEDYDRINVYNSQLVMRGNNLEGISY